jgi:hypothetical protein
MKQNGVKQTNERKRNISEHLLANVSNKTKKQQPAFSRVCAI